MYCANCEASAPPAEVIITVAEYWPLYYSKPLNRSLSADKAREIGTSPNMLEHEEDPF